MRSFTDGRRGIFFGRSVSCGAQRIACFKELQRSFAVNAEDRVLDFGVRRGIHAAGEKFVTRFDAFSASVGIFQNHGVPRLRYREIGFRSDDHAEGLHIGDGLYFAAAALQRKFAEIFRAALRRNGPQNIGEIFEAKFRCVFNVAEFRADFDATAFVLHFGFAGSGWQ